MEDVILRTIGASCLARTNFVNFDITIFTILGIPGFAAWVGVEVIAEPIKEGSNVFISAAAGAVGIYAGQLAKLKGCRVVGSTGTDDKVRKLLK